VEVSKMFHVERFVRCGRFAAEPVVHVEHWIGVIPPFGQRLPKVSVTRRGRTFHVERFRTRL